MIPLSSNMKLKPDKIAIKCRKKRHFSPAWPVRILALWGFLEMGQNHSDKDPETSELKTSGSALKCPAHYNYCIVTLVYVYVPLYTFRVWKQFTAWSQVQYNPVFMPPDALQTFKKNFFAFYWTFNWKLQLSRTLMLI